MMKLAVKMQIKTDVMFIAVDIIAKCITVVAKAKCVSC